MMDSGQSAQGELSAYDEVALKSLLHGQENLNILEIGSWLGAGSTQILAPHSSTLVCVDHWLGNESDDHRRIAAAADPFLVFMENMKPFGDRVIPIRTDSRNLRNLLREGTFDFIFIDGDHRYEGVKSDIEICLALVKPGGVIAGHDCEARLGDLAVTFTEEDMKKDHIYAPTGGFRNIHPGVILAVDEMFRGDFELFGDDEICLEDGNSGYSRIWYKSL